MPCHLPIPYPDELLYSVIARYLIHIGVKSGYGVTEDIFGRKTKAQIDLPHSLRAVSERTRLIWGLPGEEIADRFTLFPYYARYMPLQRAAQCLTLLLSDNGPGIHSRLGLNGSRVKVPRFIRFCRVCRESDLSQYGETYWRRSHQLSGVLVCPEHGEPLINTKAPMRPKRYIDYADATMATNAAPAHDTVLSKKEAVIALKIAKHCNGILSDPISSWPPEKVTLRYRRAAMERGFAGCPLSIAQAKLENAFVSFYGEALLSKIGCQIRSGTGNSWINTIFQKQKSLFHPVEHALVQIFLESLSVDTSFSSYGFGPWKCPNPYAQHEEEFPITKVKLRVRRKDQRVASARCSCGFAFTFQQMSEDDPTLPVVKRITAFGPAWIAEVKRLKESGLTTYAIGTKMGIAYSTVQRLLDNKLIDCHPSLEQIQEWRKEWMKLLDGVPDRSRSIAREKNWKLYKRLLKHDREWLYAQPKNKTRTPHPEGQVNWASRDEEWSRRLRAAAAKIRAEVPLARVTRNAMITRAGICSSIFAYVNRLPACRLALSECCETQETFRQRSQFMGETSVSSLGSYRHHREEIWRSPGAALCSK